MTQLEAMERYLRAQATRGHGQVIAPRPRICPFITISRQAGAGGHALADALIELFARQQDTDLFKGWQVFDHELCEIVAEDPVYSSSLDSLLAEEYRTKTDDFFRQILRSTIDQDDLMERVFRVVRAVAAIGKAIIIGRAGSEVTMDMHPGVSVRLIAPEAVRIKGVIDYYGLEEQEAREESRRLDASRARLLKRHFHVDIEDPSRYDVVFNTAEVPMGAIAESLVVMLRNEVEATLSTSPS